MAEELKILEELVRARNSARYWKINEFSLGKSRDGLIVLTWASMQIN
jgi:hypothetical protein